MSNKYKFYLIAGEASGDLIGSLLVKELKKRLPDSTFMGFGGKKMHDQGVKIIRPINKLSFFGIFELIKNLFTIQKNFSICKKSMNEFAPNMVILIDYPGFNLRMAKFAKKKGYKVIYYVAPKVWASREGRISDIKKYVDKLFVIFPFEVDYFKKFPKINFEYVGNPLYEIVKKTNTTFENFIKENNLPNKPIVALLPGSRISEISKLLPVYLKNVDYFHKYQFVIAGVTNIPAKVYSKYLKNHNLPILYNKTYELLTHSKMAIVTSGTATLETAILKVPQVVCYKLNFFTNILAMMFVKVSNFSLVNLCLGFEAVRELYQGNCNQTTLRDIMKQILYFREKREFILDKYWELDKLFDGKVASVEVAKSIQNILEGVKK